MVADTLLIFSSGRSDSTLLDLMIGAHPLVASLGEITYLPNIFEFLGLLSLDGEIQSAARKEHVLEGNDTHLRGLTNIKLDEAWMRKPSADGLNYFKCDIRDLNCSLGYQ